MKANPKFEISHPEFWAHVRFISERLGYMIKGDRHFKRHDTQKISECFGEEGLKVDHLLKYHNGNWESTSYHRRIEGYLNYRHHLLEDVIQNYLMNRDEAKALFEKYYNELKPQCHLPLNKQKAEKRHHAYLTCLVNMLTESELGTTAFDDNPKGLSVFTKDETLARVLSRWMDGAYPSIINPLAIWEVKEYYGTTTFGSRVADGVYETMLDGMEIREIRQKLGIDVLHYLIIDDKLTWWDMGKSYLCRIIDMLHMDLIDEVIIGREVIEAWPRIVRTWVTPLAK